jgi:hypothetical protein
VKSGLPPLPLDQNAATAALSVDAVQLRLTWPVAAVAVRLVGAVGGIVSARTWMLRLVVTDKPLLSTAVSRIS